jgi:hypothetical protein
VLALLLFLRQRIEAGAVALAKAIASQVVFTLRIADQIVDQSPEVSGAFAIADTLALMVFCWRVAANLAGDGHAGSGPQDEES